MPQEIHLLKVLVASPSDVSTERSMVADAINRINKAVFKKRNIRLEYIGWETDSYSGIGSDAQDVINNEFGDDYDIFVGIMWHRYGSPTLRSDSGTVEEFERAYENYQSNASCKKILFYFNSADYPQREVDPEQVVKVREFKESLQQKGVYYTQYAGPELFKDRIYDDIVRTVSDLDVSEKEKAYRAQGIWSISVPFENLFQDAGANFTHPRKERLLFEYVS